MLGQNDLLFEASFEKLQFVQYASRDDTKMATYLYSK